ncbi:PaeR7I family type II restriction endonuclease [Aerolutibacter daejeonensis]|uniref:PaeR7I family type II restriction endonuclease n=1 Tax=Aerolutibacter daejeonensis TaxID=346181 RepID=UPI000A03AB88|nr:PaeR7I family type II restriction endonuclease [Lysobacter daejeonensis]
MALDLAEHEALARVGIRHFWTGRSKSLRVGEGSQGGERTSVLGGKNMDGFLAIVEELVRRNGLPHAQIHTASRPLLTLPGYFRPTKLWDVLVIDRGALVAAIELKSQVGPSFGNNFNNRTEEAIGTAHDLWTTIREGALGEQPRPFLGWLILVEDCVKSRTPVRDRSPHFRVFPEFQGASYLGRYDVLCQRLMREQLYTQASVLTSPREALIDGAFGSMSPTTGLTAFAASLAGHVAAWSAVRPE